MSRRAAIAKYALLGGFSGALYGLWHFGFLMAVDGPGKDAVDYIGLASAFAGAGLFYGIIVGAALRGDLGFGLARWALLALAAAGSYFAAVEIALAIDPAGGVGAYTFVAGGRGGRIAAGAGNGHPGGRRAKNPFRRAGDGFRCAARPAAAADGGARHDGGVDRVLRRLAGGLRRRDRLQPAPDGRPIDFAVAGPPVLHLPSPRWAGSDQPNDSAAARITNAAAKPATSAGDSGTPTKSSST